MTWLSGHGDLGADRAERLDTDVELDCPRPARVGRGLTSYMQQQMEDLDALRDDEGQIAYPVDG